MENLNPGEKKKPILGWTEGVEVEQQAFEQLLRTRDLPFIYRHLAVMPDVHWGMGSTVGSVIPTRGAIIPAAVGVDIGCGMLARRLPGVNADELNDRAEEVRATIEKVVPHGRTDNGGANDIGSWDTPHDLAIKHWHCDLRKTFEGIIEKNPRIGKWGEPTRHLGTLGTGNHFIEICFDEDEGVWLMLHSGSRGIGNRIGQHFIAKAKANCEQYFVDLPDSNLSFFPEGTPGFDEYWEAVMWAQRYAELNRQIMMTNVMNAMKHLGGSFGWVGEYGSETIVECHHNYVAREHHYGNNVFVTRKGAVRAREGDLGIIPGSMGTRSYIVEGLGNKQSFHSCSHGAGRRMSRTQARKTFTVEDHVKATQGVECRKDESVIDETPGAYKDIDAVMEAQKDLVSIKHTLRARVCVKG
jgi:tRNA-splicing ligase RtcB